MQQLYWKIKKLNEMTTDEWESLCDGCGHCCLVKLQNEESGEIFKTSVACKLLDIESCTCRDYDNRHKRVPACLQLTPENVDDVNWLPETCAYKLIAAGKDLPDWHPLINNAVDEAGVSVKAFAQSEEFIHPQQLHECIIDN